MQVKPSFEHLIVDADGQQHPAIKFETDEGIYHTRIGDALLIAMLEEEDHEQYNAIMLVVQALVAGMSMDGMSA